VAVVRARCSSHSHSIASWKHDHAFLGQHHGERERRIWSMVALTAVMMVVEIVGGSMFGALALVAEGWHMGTHVAALAIAGLAYLFARRHAGTPARRHAGTPTTRAFRSAPASSANSPRSPARSSSA
jgi:Co/Zn/Cd efflux system component